MSYPTTPEVEAYFAEAPDAAKDLLNTLREVVRAALPDASEVMSYKMPAYKQGGIVVYFAHNKKHLGFYPTGMGITAFEAEFDKRGLKWSKGAVQFPLDQPLPVDLIQAIIAYRLKGMAATKSKR